MKEDLTDKQKELAAFGGFAENNEDQVEVSPAQQAQYESYCTAADEIIWSEEKHADMLQSLQQGKNEIDGVATTALLVHTNIEKTSWKKGKERLTEVTLCMGAAHIVSELSQLAEVSGLYSLNTKERLEAFRQGLQKYFAAGLSSGKINPIEFQKTIEPLMSKEQREFGLSQMEKNGLSKTAPPNNFMQGRPMQQPAGILGGA